MSKDEVFRNEIEKAIDFKFGVNVAIVFDDSQEMLDMCKSKLMELVFCPDYELHRFRASGKN